MMIRSFLLLLLFCGVAGAQPQVGDVTDSPSDDVGFTCRGEIQFRRDHTCEGPFVLKVTSTLGDGSRVEQDVGVGADGNFVVSAAKGAKMVHIGGSSPCCRVIPAVTHSNGVPRLQLRTEALHQVQYTFQSATGEELKGLEVAWFESNLLSDDWTPHTLHPDRDGVYRFSTKEWDFWVQASADGHATHARYVESHAAKRPLEQIILQPLARVSGKLVSVKGYYPSTPWLVCDVPFRPEGADEFTRRVAVADGTFDIWVPANSVISLSVEQEYGRHRKMVGYRTDSFGQAVVPALEPGQHLVGFEFPMTLDRYIAGRLVSPDGAPVVGAYVRDMRSYLGVGALGSVDPVPPRDLAVTNAQGRFLLFGDGLWYENHLAVAVEVRDDEHSPKASIIRQHFMDVGVEEGEHVFVLQPGGEAFAGRLTDGEGHGVARATLHLTPMAALKPTDTGITCYDPIPSPFMEPSPWRGRDGKANPAPPPHLFDADEVLSYTYPVTAADGSFRVEHLPPGPWRIRVKADGYAGIELTDVVLSESTSHEFVLQRACELEVSVIKADGTPAKGAPFYLNLMVDGNQVGRNERRQYADQEGVLRYFVDEAGTYRLERAGNPSFGLVVVLKQGQRVAETLHELPLGSVSGVLDWPGAPDRMRVQLEGPGVPLYKSYSLTQFGRFHFDDVSPGTYTLLLSGGGLTKEMQARLDIPKVEVLPGQDCIVTIRLKPEVEPSR